VNYNNEYIPYPEKDPLQFEDIMVYVAKIMSNELKGKKGAVDQVKNPELIKKIEKNIGDLVHLDNFDAEVMIEGTDAVVLLFSSSADHPA